MTLYSVFVGGLGELVHLYSIFVGGLGELVHLYSLFVGGPLGELVQWSDIISSLYILGHDLVITSEVEQLTQ